MADAPSRSTSGLETKPLPDLQIYIDPLGKPRMTQRDKWKKRPATERYYAYKDALNSQLRIPEWGVDDVLSLTFIIPMPKSWAKKKRAAFNGQPHQTKPDLDNLIKAFKDCLLKEDSVVWQYGPMKKVWGERGAIIIHQ